MKKPVGHVTTDEVNRDSGQVGAWLRPIRQGRSLLMFVPPYAAGWLAALQDACPLQRLLWPSCLTFCAAAPERSRRHSLRSLLVKKKNRPAKVPRSLIPKVIRLAALKVNAGLGQTALFGLRSAPHILKSSLDGAFKGQERRWPYRMLVPEPSSRQWQCAWTLPVQASVGQSARHRDSATIKLRHYQTFTPAPQNYPPPASPQPDRTESSAYCRRSP